MAIFWAPIMLLSLDEAKDFAIPTRNLQSNKIH